MNGGRASILLDSGASISVVPDVMVGQELRTGEQVSVRTFQSKVPMTLPTAKVAFIIGDLSWVELVALAPVEEGREKEVLYGLDLTSERGLDLVLMANRLEQAKGIRRVTTRSEAKEASQREEEEAKVVSVEQPSVKPIEAELMSSDESTGEGKPVADRPAGGPEPGAGELAIGEKRNGEETLVDAEVDDAEILVEEKSTYVESSEGSEKFDLRVKGRGHEELEIPPVMSGNASRAELVGGDKG